MRKPDMYRYCVKDGQGRFQYGALTARSKKAAAERVQVKGFGPDQIISIDLALYDTKRNGDIGTYLKWRLLSEDGRRLTYAWRPSYGCGVFWMLVVAGGGFLLWCFRPPLWAVIPVVLVLTWMANHGLWCLFRDRGTMIVERVTKEISQTRWLNWRCSQTVSVDTTLVEAVHFGSRPDAMGLAWFVRLKRKDGSMVELDAYTKQTPQREMAEKVADYLDLPLIAGEEDAD